MLHINELLIKNEGTNLWGFSLRPSVCFLVQISCPVPVLGDVERGWLFYGTKRLDGEDVHNYEDVE